MQEFEIVDLEFIKKYKHPAINWFKKRHVALLDG
jgi:hypothetical protein